MTFPQRAEPLVESKDANISEDAPTGDGLRVEPARAPVLVVEDDPTHRELLVEMVNLWGYEALAVASAEEAELAVKRRPVFAAIVDVILPGRSGPSLMSRLRIKYPEAILIGISALGDAATARKCKGLGADIFIGKPVMPDELAKALRSKHQSWH